MPIVYKVVYTLQTIVNLCCLLSSRACRSVEVEGLFPHRGVWSVQHRAQGSFFKGSVFLYFLNQGKSLKSGSWLGTHSLRIRSRIFVSHSLFPFHPYEYYEYEYPTWRIVWRRLQHSSPIIPPYHGPLWRPGNSLSRWLIYKKPSWCLVLWLSDRKFRGRGLGEAKDLEGSEVLKCIFKS